MRAAVFVLIICLLSFQKSHSYALQGGWNLTKIHNLAPSNPIFMNLADIVVSNSILMQANFTGCRNIIYTMNPN